MLDVHPPEHAAHSWRDFFIHIATIVVGLLIAVSLEQTVEFLHHRHQRAELREALMVDAEKAIEDCENIHHSAQTKLPALESRIVEVQTALKTHQPLPAAAVVEGRDWDEPIAPSWKAALSSQTVHVLPQDEIQVFSEVNGVVDTLESLHWPMNFARQRVVEVAKKYGFDAKQPANATPQQLEEYLDALIHAQTQVELFDQWAGGVRGAEKAILRGERNLDKVQAAERDPW